jgi:hypothetical protein
MADRDEEIGPESDIELLDGIREGRRPVQEFFAQCQRVAGVGDGLGEQDAGFLEELAQCRDVGGERVVRFEVAPETQRGSFGIEGGARRESGIVVGAIDPATGEHVKIRGERHRRRALRQQDLEGAGGGVSDEDDRRRRQWRWRWTRGHPDIVPVRCPVAGLAAGRRWSPLGVAGRRWASLGAAGRPSEPAPRSCRSRATPRLTRLAALQQRAGAAATERPTNGLPPNADPPIVAITRNHRANRSHVPATDRNGDGLARTREAPGQRWALMRTS